jgi:uncharacterized protein YjbI with pentapeptide repeats
MDLSPKIAHIPNAAGEPLYTYTDAGHTSYTTILQDALIADVDLTGAVFKDEHFEAGLVACSVFENCDFSNVNMMDFEFTRCEFFNCDFTDANFVKGKLSECTFDLCDFTEASFDRTHLEHVSFAECRLTNASFYNAILESVDLTACDVCGSHWYYGTLNDCTSNRTNWEACATVAGTNLGELQADFPILQVNGIGSRKRTTTFFPRQDVVICGCFKGNFDTFVTQVDNEYGLAGKPKLYRNQSPQTIEHGREYVRALQYLASCADNGLSVNVPAKRVPANLMTFLFGDLLGPFGQYETVYDA